MTTDSVLSLLCKLNDTIDAQQQQIDALSARIKELENADSGNSDNG